MEKLKKELKKQKDKESTLLEEKDKLTQVQLISATLFLGHPNVVYKQMLCSLH